MAGIRLEVWGNYAIFTPPTVKAERNTYEVITPAAARGIIESIYWHPGVIWVIDKIYVLSPIRYVNLKRNEIKGVLSFRTLCSKVKNDKCFESYDPGRNDGATQRMTRALKDVHYVIEAHFDVNLEKLDKKNSPDKILGEIMKRIEKGKCFKQPYFGCKECIAYFKKYESSTVPVEPSLKGTRELGKMLYDMDYTKEAESEEKKYLNAIIFEAVMVDGVIDLTKEGVIY